MGLAIYDAYAYAYVVVEDIKTALAKRIQKRRRQIYGTQERLAAQIGKPQSTVSRWEKGLQTPSYEHLVLLAGAFQMTVADLAGFPDITPDMPDEQAASS